MNVESLKSELQQVLDNDVLLRKEFNSLKRSLSDYRNQLIMRDEDCKRLQVTIDVLNTKLVVMERDNSSYKAELSSFKELRGSIHEQLEEKQIEIDARLLEIQTLREELNSMAANYESALAELRSSSSSELERVKAEYDNQISNLKNNAHYIESGIREEYENRLSDLSTSWSEKEQNLLMSHQDAVLNLENLHEARLSEMKNTYEQQISGLSAGSSEQVQNLQEAHNTAISELENSLTSKMESMSTVYQEEIQNLRAALEEQRSTLTSNFNRQVENLQIESEQREQTAKEAFELQLAGLETSKATEIADTISAYDARISTLIAEYEEKVSNTLIHSNSQNSKLNDELVNVRGEQEQFQSLTEEMKMQLEQTAIRVSELENLLIEKDQLLSASGQETMEAQATLEALRSQSTQMESERIEELNLQLSALNQSHSDFVLGLQEQIEQLSLEVSNLGLVLESTTNLLSETENKLDDKVQELSTAQTQIEELNARIQSFSSSFEDKELELENYKQELEESVKAELDARNLEFDKLLAENGQLISEIDLAQDKVEAHEYEISLLKAELEEIRVQSLGKADYFKETLANRNFEVTNLEANNAALSKEVQMLKEEMQGVQQNLQETLGSSEELAELRMRLEERSSEIVLVRAENAALEMRIQELMHEKIELASEITSLTEMVSDLNLQIVSLNEVIDKNASDLKLVAETSHSEQDAFIDRLFKQIDDLNDQRLALLDEKDQMAQQLLKMNEVLGSISQQVDSESIDVTGLNNHRKNIILANNSGASGEQNPMKEQINDLVREIDKCIALLSA